MSAIFRLSLLILVLALPCVAQADPVKKIPSGTYTLDPHHTSVIFRINHLGFSNFTGRFDKVEGSFDYDAGTQAPSNLDVTVYPDNIDTNVEELDEILRSENWFDTLKYPIATFHATIIQIDNDNTATIIGNFTLHGVTHTLTLNAKLIGAGTMPMSDTQVVGFSATATFNRADYGIDNLEPLLGDKIDLQIDTEFDLEQ